MKKERFALACALSGMVLLTTSMPSLASPDDLLERGRYLVKIAGCNDCHTAGYSVQAGQVPEEKWLTGDSFGWRGEWGTTYATNLRMSLQGFTEAQWLAYAKSLKPPPADALVHAQRDEGRGSQGDLSVRSPPRPGG